MPAKWSCTAPCTLIGARHRVPAANSGGRLTDKRMQLFHLTLDVSSPEEGVDPVAHQSGGPTPLRSAFNPIKNDKCAPPARACPSGPDVAQEAKTVSVKHVCQA